MQCSPVALLVHPTGPSHVLVPILRRQNTGSVGSTQGLPQTSHTALKDLFLVHSPSSSHSTWQGRGKLPCFPPPGRHGAPFHSLPDTSPLGEGMSGVISRRSAGVGRVSLRTPSWVGAPWKAPLARQCGHCLGLSHLHPLDFRAKGFSRYMRGSASSNQGI